MTRVPVTPPDGADWSISAETIEGGVALVVEYELAGEPAGVRLRLGRDEARKTIRPGDRITRTRCGGTRGTFTFTGWDGEALCGRTVSDCHAANVIAVNGVARRFGDQVEIARASEAFRVAREAERAARGPGRPLAPTDDPVPR